jgi:demethylmenaquinone methyltransferase/2-methoxy-6-polyprenyl-1,4-benzoquinol methylase
MVAAMTPPAHAHAATPAETEPFTRALELMNRFQEPEGREAIAALGFAPGSRGLDVGCGVGLYTQWLAEAVGPAGRVIGIEPTAERVEAARALVGNALPDGRLEFRTGDATRLDFEPASFDWLWCGDVLHHVQATGTALAEFVRVVRPGGQVVIKESQVASAMFLPGHPELERRLHAAEMEWSRAEAGDQTFQERRQRTLQSLREAGLDEIGLRAYLIQRRAPLAGPTREYIERVVFGRNWGPRLRDLLEPADWDRRSALCEPASIDFVLARPDYYCLYPITIFTARCPGAA